jgi:deazaflavin-dependent oxidoreductase (nitroreductase family)
VKRRLVTTFQKYLLNPLVRRIAGVIPGPVLLETTGRRTGRPRTTPVGAVLEGNGLWVVAEQGRHAAYVRNIEANPRVRVRSKGRWRSGTATLRPDVDGKTYARGLNGAVVRIVGTELLAIRIDLDES